MRSLCVGFVSTDDECTRKSDLDRKRNMRAFSEEMAECRKRERLAGYEKLMNTKMNTKMNKE